jgi:hypothetical protein
MAFYSFWFAPYFFYNSSIKLKRLIGSLGAGLLRPDPELLGRDSDQDACRAFDEALAGPNERFIFPFFLFLKCKFDD